MHSGVQISCEVCPAFGGFPNKKEDILSSKDFQLSAYNAFIFIYIIISIIKIKGVNKYCNIMKENNKIWKKN